MTKSSYPRIPLSIAILVVVVAGAEGTSSQEDATIVPGERVGVISASVDLARLVSLFGQSLVVERPFSTGEGFCIPGTVVFPGTPDELEIAWQDQERSRIATVRIRRAGGRWVTAEGVRVGTSLQDLERLNGGPLTFGGFGWDYGGRVASWEGGRLARKLSDGVSLGLDADGDALRKIGGGPRARVLLGDKLVRSELPIVRRAGITVHAIRGGPHPLDRCSSQLRWNPGS